MLYKACCFCQGKNNRNESNYISKHKKDKNHQTKYEKPLAPMPLLKYTTTNDTTNLNTNCNQVRTYTTVND